MAGEIVVCGVDQNLLSTRSDVLRSVGFDVTATSRPDEILRLGREQKIRAIVLCHTLTAAQQQSAISTLRSQWPEAKSVVLTAPSTRILVEEADAFVSSSEGPRALIRALERLL